MKRCLLFAFSLASSSFVFAHDTWITPSAYSATVDQPVMFEITSGMNFPALDTGPKPNRIAKSGFRLGAERLDRRREHFMSSSLLQSQWDTLELLDADESGITLDITEAPDELAAKATELLRRV